MDYQAIIDRATEAAINAACAEIQAALGVTSGDLAGVHFADGGPQRDHVRTAVHEYLQAEAADAGKVPQWTSEHSAAAEAEGWNLFSHSGDLETDEAHIERDDEANILECDGEACALVFEGVAPHHVAARAFLSFYAPENYALMKDEAAAWRRESLSSETN